MESLALLPTDPAAFLGPLARPAAAHQGALEVADAALPGADAFAQFLSLLAPPLAGGQVLPSSGNSLPLALPDPAAMEPEPGVQNTAETPSGDPVAMAGLTAWLPLRTDPVATAIEIPLEAAVDSSVRTPLEVGFARTPLGSSPLPTPSGLAEPATPRGPNPGTVVTRDLLATSSPDAPAAEVPLAAAEVPAGETLEAETFDALVRGDALSDGPRPRADGRVAAQAPAAPTVDPAVAVAVREAPPDPAALQANRGPDVAVGAPRSPRKVDAVALAGSMATFTEVSAVAAAEGPPPAMPTVGATQNAAPPGAPAGMMEAPVDARGPQWQEALAGRVQWLVDQRVGEARIKLNPPELGSVDVKISLVEDKTYVQLTAATAAARDELAQSLPRLRDLFAASGLELGGASVHGGRGGHPGAGGGYESEPRFAGDQADLDLLPPAEPIRVARRSAGAIDIFA
jgi:hypothetical protein